MRALESLVILVMFCAAMMCVYLYFSSPEYTAQYASYAAARTAIRQAEEQASQVQAREWGDTMRTWGMWGGSAFAVVGGLVAIAWGVKHWQEQRTQRHVATEEQTTERLRITAKKEIGLAWIGAFGVPERDSIGTHGGQLGVFTVEDGAPTFVTIDACRAELAAAQANQGTELARRTPQTISVPPATQERRLLMSGETEQEDW